MLRAKFFLRKVKFYTENVRASVTSSMSGLHCECHSIAVRIGMGERVQCSVLNSPQMYSSGQCTLYRPQYNSAG